MADISNVQTSDLKEIADSLEALSCKLIFILAYFLVLTHAARILTRVLY